MVVSPKLPQRELTVALEDDPLPSAVTQSLASAAGHRGSVEHHAVALVLLKSPCMECAVTARHTGIPAKHKTHTLFLLLHSKPHGYRALSAITPVYREPEAALPLELQRAVPAAPGSHCRRCSAARCRQGPSRTRGTSRAGPSGIACTAGCCRSLCVRRCSQLGSGPKAAARSQCWRHWKRQKHGSARMRSGREVRGCRNSGLRPSGGCGQCTVRPAGKSVGQLQSKRWDRHRCCRQTHGNTIQPQSQRKTERRSQIYPSIK